VFKYCHASLANPCSPILIEILIVFWITMVQDLEEKKDVESTQPQSPNPSVDGSGSSHEGSTTMAQGSQKKHPFDDKQAFNKGEKWLIVGMIAFAGLFRHVDWHWMDVIILINKRLGLHSPFTANIYFPAIPTLTVAFHKSTELINLTVCFVKSTDVYVTNHVYLAR
jgi:hypothetical protein